MMKKVLIFQYSLCVSYLLQSTIMGSSRPSTFSSNGMRSSSLFTLFDNKNNFNDTSSSTNGSYYQSAPYSSQNYTQKECPACPPCTVTQSDINKNQINITSKSALSFTTDDYNSANTLLGQIISNLNSPANPSQTPYQIYIQSYGLTLNTQMPYPNPTLASTLAPLFVLYGKTLAQNINGQYANLNNSFITTNTTNFLNSFTIPSTETNNITSSTQYLPGVNYFPVSANGIPTQQALDASIANPYVIQTLISNFLKPILPAPTDGAAAIVAIKFILDSNNPNVNMNDTATNNLSQYFQQDSTGQNYILNPSYTLP